MFSYSAIIEPMVSKYPEKGCQLKFSNNWMSGKMGIAFPKDAPITGLFNWQLQRFEELGILTRIQQVWYSWDFDRFCQAQNTGLESLGFHVAKWFFAVLAGGAALALGIMGLECLVAASIHRKKGGMNYDDEDDDGVCLKKKR